MADALFYNRKLAKTNLHLDELIMVKIILDIDGMACGMCEAHVNEAVRKAFVVKKVTSFHSKGRTEIIAEAPVDEVKLKEIIEETGYKVLSIHTEAYEKRGFFLCRR